MTEQDPKQVIIEFLCSPLGEVEPNPSSSADSVDKWQGRRRSAGGLGARAETLQFLKERSIPSRQLHAVTFEDEAGLERHFICLVRQDTEGRWHFEAGGGGGGPKGAKPPSRRKQPQANLARGGGGAHGFWAGGYVESNDIPVAKVRLISGNGQVLEDTVQDSLVLFVTDQGMQTPIQVELSTLSGELVGQQILFEH